MDDKSDNVFPQLQEANNNSLAAYKEVMTLAINEKACKMSLPPLGSIEDIQQMFKTPPSPGMKVESPLSAPFFFFLSKVIWTENVEVKDCKVDVDDDIQSGTMNSNPAFNTKH
ncbi:hypothetical protein ACFX15_034964 [Malus domestica]